MMGLGSRHTGPEVGGTHAARGPASRPALLGHGFRVPLGGMAPKARAEGPHLPPLRGAAQTGRAWTAALRNLQPLLPAGRLTLPHSGWAPKYFPPAVKREINGRLQDKVMFGSDYPVLA
ncbi:MAG: amidohydrolase family protein, partial [Candidatus Rokuibacteriota bacterium]